MPCVVVLGDTPALVVGEFCSRWSNANCQSLACTAHKIIEYGSVRKRGGYKCEFFFDRMDNNFVWILLDVVCVVARCCVRVVCVIQLSRSSQASPWLCTKMISQD